MTLDATLLLPNLGRESAVFLTHILQHWDALPHSLVLLHDHGPSSKHTLCGPFYRRLRAYHRGVADTMTGTNSTQRQFARYPVTLSSGCMERFSRGCCAMLACMMSLRTGQCPWVTDLCRKRDSRNPNDFLFWRYRYDSRSENRLVEAASSAADSAGMDGGGSGGTAASAKWTTKTITSYNNVFQMEELDMPADYNTSIQGDGPTSRRFKAILAKYAINTDQPYSCCATLAVASSDVRRWPRPLYDELLAFALDPAMGYDASKAVELTAWPLWHPGRRPFSPDELLTYYQMDRSLKAIQGCPAMPPHLEARVAQALAGETEAGGTPAAAAVAA